MNVINFILVVHNGIITNYKDIKMFLVSKGYKFESETDTEVIAKLIKHIRYLPTQDGILFLILAQGDRT